MKLTRIITKKMITFWLLSLVAVAALSLCIALVNFSHLTLVESSILLIGVIVTVLFIRFGIRWIETQLVGIEDLAQRSKLVLDNHYEQALAEKGEGQPRLINRAMTHLLLELDEAQKHRARFDQFIRSNTFLDPQTGIGNQLFFSNRLDALTSTQGMVAPGAMILLALDDLELLQQKLGDDGTTEWLELLITTINRLLDRYANSIFSRRSHEQFAIIVPLISLKEVEKLAARLLKVCNSQELGFLPNQENFFHIGAAYFKVGDDKMLLIDEAEQALRAAQFQGDTGWFMYDTDMGDDELVKGSVRWRSFLESALVNHRLVIFTQPVIDSDMQVDHFEVSSRIRDNDNKLIRATIYLPMAIKCGLTPQFERQVIEQVLFGLLSEQYESTARYSINLSLDTLISRDFVQWLKFTLSDHQKLTSQIIFEINEDMLVQHLELLKGTLTMIRELGVQLCVDRVGQQVVSTDYLQVCHINSIKLHRSIVRQIHLRQENQLFVRSLIGGLYRRDITIFADSVESFEELQTLKILGVSAAQGGIFSEPQEVTFNGY